MKYQSGDKVVFKIDEHDVSDLSNGNDISFFNEQLLGRLEDFQTDDKKIIMTVEEKKEFDELKRIHKSLFLTLKEINIVNYPNLCERLFCNNNDVGRNKAQLDFSRAWDKPSRIEVVKDKKYYVHLLENDSYGYLNQNVSTKEYFISTKEESDNYKTKFTKSEIEKMHFDNFKFNDDALEEVEDD